MAVRVNLRGFDLLIAAGARRGLGNVRDPLSLFRNGSRPAFRLIVCGIREAMDGELGLV